MFFCLKGSSIVNFFNQALRPSPRIAKKRCRTPLSTSVGLGKISNLILISDPGDSRIVFFFSRFATNLLTSPALRMKNGNTWIYLVTYWSFIDSEGFIRMSFFHLSLRKDLSTLSVFPAISRQFVPPVWDLQMKAPVTITQTCCRIVDAGFK